MADLELADAFDAFPALGASFDATTDRLAVLDTSTGLIKFILGSVLVDDTAYNATSWNAVTGIAPSKNAVRDKIENLQPLTALLSAFTAAVTLSDAATIATDASLGHRFRVTLGDNRTLGNPTNAYNGQQLVWEIIQDGTGSRTITLDSKFALGTDITAVTLTTTINKRDFLTAIYNSTADKFYVVGFVKGY
jgi:hypothetical protein